MIPPTGRGEKIRTSDPLVPNQVRYQAALRPDAREVYRKTARYGNLEPPSLTPKHVLDGLGGVVSPAT